MLFSAAAYLLVVAVLVIKVCRGAGGHFIYALDDPYIHLALAEQLAHGHYGINPNEMSSPSSSILWPFLLIPFAGTKIHQYVPLLWNIVFGTAAACLIGAAVSRWPPQKDERGRMPLWQQMVTAVLLILVANLASLTLVGMEHVLQVLLAICCAYGMMEALSGRRMPAWSVAAAVIAPMVRYEDIGLTAAMCLTLVGLKQRRKAVAVLALAVAPLIGFSIFLHSEGLPVLPLSVLIKGNAYSSSHTGLMAQLRTVRRNIYGDMLGMDRFSLDVLVLTFIALAWKDRVRLRRYIFAGTALVGGAHLLIGRFGWFGRYEVYAVIFSTMLCMYVLSEGQRFLFGYFVLGLTLCAAPYIETTQSTINASLDIYRSQYQMHRFVTEFYKGDYAVNDLGMVSFQRRPGAYVLDVYGLASPEAARQSIKSAAWLHGIVERHGIKLAMLFPDWFTIPDDWKAMAQMCEPGRPVVMTEQCMVFYSTTPSAEAQIRSELQEFAKTLPSDVIFHLDPDPKWGSQAPYIPQ